MHYFQVGEKERLSYGVFARDDEETLARSVYLPVKIKGNIDGQLYSWRFNADHLADSLSE
jgi:hypothetical protein